MKSFSDKDKISIRERLIHWFKKNQRDLPWRKTYEPYHVWISEIMLQQTQVTTVLPYFRRWIKKFPTIASVAKAKEDAILKLWEGLGYYSRARNLQKAARRIVDQYKGLFPKNYDDILALPGVGRYTAGAIASIAFDQKKPIVDGNVIRALARLRGFRQNVRDAKNVKKFWEWSESLLPETDLRYFNQGLMELGALVCTPKNPKCDQCPLKNNCHAFEKQTVDVIPNQGKKQELIPIKAAVAIIKKDGKIFIQKRPSGGLMGGLWEFPGGKIKNESVRKGLEREIKEEIGIRLKNIKLFKKIRHGYTKFKVDLRAYTAELDGENQKIKAASQAKWVRIQDLKKYPFPAANVRLIEELEKKSNV